MTPRPHALTLDVDRLDAARGGRTVVEGVTFGLAPGEAIVLRGANGAGKTSILRAIAGFSRPTGGDIRFKAPEGPRDAAEVRATDIHWLGGGDGLADRLSASEHLSFWRGVFGGGAETTATAALSTAALPQRAGTLSTGQRRRLALSRLTAAPRALWLLDEPLNGLDTHGRDRVLEAIADHRNAGGIVLMASHDATLPGAASLVLATGASAS